MKHLASLQRAFQTHIYAPGRAMESIVAGTPRADTARRLGVYVDAYRSRLVEALGSDYPALQRVLGDRQFDRTMREFVAAHPSRHPNLRWYGAELAQFLARSPRWQRRPRLAELARFEWALGLAFDAADARAVTPEEVARVPAADWPGMRLRLDPSVRQLRLRSNAPDLWQAATTGRQPPLAVMRPRPLSWLVWRKNHQPFYRALPPAEAWALGAAARGGDFAALVNGLRRVVGSGQAAQTGAQLLRNWLDAGLICGIVPGQRRLAAESSN